MLGVREDGGDGGVLPSGVAAEEGGEGEGFVEFGGGVDVGVRVGVGVGAGEGGPPACEGAGGGEQFGRF